MRKLHKLLEQLIFGLAIGSHCFIFGNDLARYVAKYFFCTSIKKYLEFQILATDRPQLSALHHEQLELLNRARVIYQALTSFIGAKTTNRAGDSSKQLPTKRIRISRLQLTPKMQTLSKSATQNSYKQIRIYGFLISDMQSFCSDVLKLVFYASTNHSVVRN